MQWRSRILRPILVVCAALGSVDAALFAGQHGAHGAWWPGAAALPVVLVLWYAALSSRVAAETRTWLALGILYASALLALCTMGIGAGGVMGLFGFVALTALLLGRRAAQRAFSLALLTMAGCAAAYASGWLRVVDASVLDPTSPWNWLRASVFTAGMVVAVGGVASLLLQELTTALAERIALVQQLRKEADERDRAMAALAQAQERLLHAHKLEAVGRLAGGIAHDFNNTLTVILSYAELLKTRLGRAHALSELTDQIIQAAEQGGDLTKQLLTFSRRQVLTPRVIELNQVLKATERTLARLVPKSVRIELKAAAEELFVNIDPTQLQQAVLNIALNARDAMPQGGVLSIESRGESVESSSTLPLVPGEYVVLRVRDTGTGMSAETLARIFEPFFTTKEPGLGTGLGLSNVHETVESAGGHVEVKTELGKGSEFALYFPRAAARTSGIEQTPVQGISHAALVLVVDDEPQVRDVIRTMLADTGYRVKTAESAAQALSVLEAEPVDLVCTDLVMPDVSGVKLIEQLRLTRPGLPLIVCSAYGTDEAVGQRVARGEVLLLSKPFTRKDLLEAVERALSPRPNGKPMVAG